MTRLAVWTRLPFTHGAWVPSPLCQDKKATLQIPLPKSQNQSETKPEGDDFSMTLRRLKLTKERTEVEGSALKPCID